MLARFLSLSSLEQVLLSSVFVGVPVDLHSTCCCTCFLNLSSQPLAYCPSLFSCCYCCCCLTRAQGRIFLGSVSRFTCIPCYLPHGLLASCDPELIVLGALHRRSLGCQSLGLPYADSNSPCSIVPTSEIHGFGMQGVPVSLLLTSVSSGKPQQLLLPTWISCHSSPLC